MYLQKMKFATREHLQSIAELHLGTNRNALKVLGEMKELIHSRNHKGKNVYYLARKGADIIGVEDIPQWSLQIDHYLLRNDMYVYFQCPLDWGTEVKLELKPAIGEPKILIADAVFSLNGRDHFLEVDRTQSMVENKKKIDYYAQVHHLLTNQPELIFYTTTPTRRETLTKLCKEKNLNFKIYTKEDLA